MKFGSKFYGKSSWVAPVKPSNSKQAQRSTNSPLFSTCLGCLSLLRLLSQALQVLSGLLHKWVSERGRRILLLTDGKDSHFRVAHTYLQGESYKPLHPNKLFFPFETWYTREVAASFRRKESTYTWENSLRTAWVHDEHMRLSEKGAFALFASCPTKRKPLTASSGIRVSCGAREEKLFS